MYRKPVFVKRFHFSVLQFALKAVPALAGKPKSSCKDPLKPINLFFLNMMFKIPAVPSASYLADGEVITSTFSIASAGICLNASAPFMPTKALGLPSINMVTFSFPRKLTVPSTLTCTDGTLPKTSLAFPPRIDKSLPILNIFLSKRISTVVFSATITISSKPFVASDNFITPKSLSEIIFSFGNFIDWKEINATFIV